MHRQWLAVSMTFLSAAAWAGPDETDSRGTPGVEECHVLWGDPPEPITSQSIDVQGLTRRDTFVVPERFPTNISAILCHRDGPVPAENDYKVLLAGIPLAIAPRTGGIVWVQIKEGRLEVEYMKGAFTEAEEPRVQAWLDRAQLGVNQAGRLRSKLTADPAVAKGELEKTVSDLGSAPLPPCLPGREGALADGVVTIKPGETVCVRFTRQGNALRPVAIVSGPETRTDAGVVLDDVLIVRAWRSLGDRETFLVLHGAFAGPVRYKASMLRTRREQPESTSTCPLRKLSLETWPYSLEEIRLVGFEVLPAAAEMVCE